jgi:hypothetical protein
LVRRAKGYLIHNSELYHRSTLGILQRCIFVEEGKALLLDIHKGIDGTMLGQEAWPERLSGRVFTI